MEKENLVDELTGDAAEKIKQVSTRVQYVLSLIPFLAIIAVFTCIYNFYQATNKDNGKVLRYMFIVAMCTMPIFIISDVWVRDLVVGEVIYAIIYAIFLNILVALVFVYVQSKLLKRILPPKPNPVPSPVD